MRGMDRRMVQAKVAGGEALKRECKINEADESGIAGHSLITSMPSALLGFMGCRNWTVPFPNMAVRRESGEGTQGLGTSNDRKVWGRVSSSSARGAGRDGQGSRVGRRRPPPPPADSQFSWVFWGSANAAQPRSTQQRQESS